MSSDAPTASEVLDWLGGNQPVGEMTGRSPAAVSAWRRIGTFPANTFLVMQAALKAQGKDVPSSLWGMKEPAESAA